MRYQMSDEVPIQLGVRRECLLDAYRFFQSRIENETNSLLKQQLHEYVKRTRMTLAALNKQDREFRKEAKETPAYQDGDMACV